MALLVIIFSAKVQVAALKACSSLLAYLSMDDDGMKFRSLVQPSLEVKPIPLPLCHTASGNPLYFCCV